MERPISHVQHPEGLTPARDHEAVVHTVSPEVREQVMDYWHSLGLTEPETVARLADECLHRARRRAGRGSDQVLLMRALEEAQRRFDHAMARMLKLPPSRDAHPIAAARAAMLLAEGQISADALFHAAEPTPEFTAALHHALPSPTPTEAHLHMPEQPLRFWLFRSTHHRS